MKVKYYSLLRPIGIGTHPKEGIIEFKNYDYRTYIPNIDHEAWGELWYGRELTEKEVNNYDLKKEIKS